MGALLHFLYYVFRPGPRGGWEEVFESFIICSLWNQAVNLMAKWHWAFTRGG